MRFSLSAVTALLLVSSGPLALASADTDAKAEVKAEPKPDTTPDYSPTPTKTKTVKARETSGNLLGALYQLASSYDLRACVPAVLPLVTVLPKIPPALLQGGAISQALGQTTRGLDEVCDFSVTGTAGEAFTSFLPTWYSWYNVYSDRLASITTKCPGAEDLIRTVEAYETCPQVVAQITAASSVTATGTDATATASESESTESSETTSTDSPAATHETGFLGAAAAAAAGVLGVVAVL